MTATTISLSTYIVVAFVVVFAVIPRSLSAEATVAPAAPTTFDQAPSAPNEVPTINPSTIDPTNAPAAAPTDEAQALNLGHTQDATGDQTAPNFATLDFVESSARFTTVRETPVYVSASTDAPIMYTLPPGVGIQATERSKDGKWLVGLTEDRQAAFLQHDALGPYQPNARLAVPVLPDAVSGSARVMDTATLSVDGKPIALFGIEGEGGILADQLQKQITVNGATVNCRLREQTYQCSLANGTDIARLALYNGAARPGPDAPDDYLRQAEAAKAGNRGIWRDRQSLASKDDTGPGTSGGWAFPADWSAWVGKYLHDRVRGVELLEIPQVRDVVYATIGPRERKELDDLGVSNPIERHGDWIVAHGCKPHDCTGSNYTLAISGDALTVIVCFKADNFEGHTSTVSWYRTGRPSDRRKYPIQIGGGCAANGIDPMPALLGRIAVDGDGRPL